MGEWVREGNLQDLAGGLEDSESGMAPSHAAEVFSSRLFRGTGHHHLNAI